MMSLAINESDWSCQGLGIGTTTIVQPVQTLLSCEGLARETSMYVHVGNACVEFLDTGVDTRALMLLLKLKCIAQV